MNFFWNVIICASFCFIQFLSAQTVTIPSNEQLIWDNQSIPIDLDTLILNDSATLIIKTEIHLDLQLLELGNRALINGRGQHGQPGKTFRSKRHALEQVDSIHGGSGLNGAHLFIQTDLFIDNGGRIDLRGGNGGVGGKSGNGGNGGNGGRLELNFLRVQTSKDQTVVCLTAGGRGGGGGAGFVGMKGGQGGSRGQAGSCLVKGTRK